jgi:hypothetical protein
VRALIWGATFVAFPVGGLLAMWIAGAIDDIQSALLGGGIVGAVVGVAQSLGSRAIDPARFLPITRWAAATAVGMSLGLAAGASVVGFETSLQALIVVGLVTGLFLGVAQAIALPRSLAPGILSRALWAASTPIVLAAGWTVTTAAGVRVDEQFAVFGATGALVATALVGVALWLLSASARRGAGSTAVRS